MDYSSLPRFEDSADNCREDPLSPRLDELDLVFLFIIGIGFGLGFFLLLGVIAYQL
jgi:hypothetical protein